MQDRIPPHNLEAEQSVLSAILIDRSVLPKIAELVKPGDFYRQAEQQIYRAMLDLRSRARRLQAEGGLDFIVIDYLQLMQGSKSRKANDNRQQEVTEISQGLKALARELQVPVLALSQLSRSVELRQNKQPMLSDLRESGSLEQDADIVLFLYRDDYYKGADDAPSHITVLIVAKHRNGPTGRVTLFFKEDCTKFVSLVRRRMI